MDHARPGGAARQSQSEEHLRHDAEFNAWQDAYIQSIFEASNT
jgi:hypothetical protein